MSNTLQIIEKCLAMYRTAYGGQRMGPELAGLWRDRLERFNSDAIYQSFIDLLERNKFAFALSEILDTVKARTPEFYKAKKERGLPPKRPTPAFVRTTLQAEVDYKLGVIDFNGMCDAISSSQSHIWGKPWGYGGGGLTIGQKWTERFEEIRAKKERGGYEDFKPPDSLLGVRLKPVPSPSKPLPQGVHAFGEVAKEVMADLDERRVTIPDDGEWK